MKNRILFSLFSLLIYGSLAAQGTRIGAHEGVSKWQVPTNSFASVDEGKYYAQQIIEAMGLKPSFEVMAARVPNAAAVVYGGKRYVLYNPDFMNKLTRATGTKWAAISVLAHEIGHHLNGHTISGKGSHHASELEADEFSGFALKKLGASLHEAQVAMKIASNERASKTHPGQTDRLTAIQRGWERAGGKVTQNDVAVNKPVQRQVQTQTQTQSRTAQPIAASQIIGKIRFTADPNSEYYVTTRYNIVKVASNKLSVIGKLSTLNSSNYPYMISDSDTKLYVNRRGTIMTERGQVVGTLSA